MVEFDVHGYAGSIYDRVNGVLDFSCESIVHIFCLSCSL